MCWKTGLRTVGVLVALILSPFTLSADGRVAATVCASAVDDCEYEAGSVCVQDDGILSLDKKQRKP